MPSPGAITLQIDTKYHFNPESRPPLSANRDVLGMPKTVVQWQRGEREHLAFSAHRQLFQRQCQARNFARIRWQES